MVATLSDIDVNLAVAAGRYNISRREETEQELRLEYQSSRSFWLLCPLAGAMYTDKRSFHIYAGVRLPTYLGRYLELTPSFGGGFYKSGSQLNLGFPIEFRSGVELSLSILDGTVGMAFYHTSNARLGSSNPGAESLAITFSWPISWDKPGSTVVQL